VTKTSILDNSKSAGVVLSTYLRQEVFAMNKAEDPRVAVAIAEERRQNEEAAERHPVVSREEWLKRRLTLMEKEKQYLRAGDELAAEVRALPLVEIEKSYTFTSPQGDLMLADLFKQHSQLLIKHFMMEPGQEWQCQGCSLASDHIDGLLPHFEHHDLSYVAVSWAPIEQIEVVRRRME
jgi:predicted dithiol-disulfide oxidoreductase (DUF899 family)